MKDLNALIDKMLEADGETQATLAWQQSVYNYAKPHIGEQPAMELSLALHDAAVVHANGNPTYSYKLTCGTLLRLAKLDLNARAKRKADREAGHPRY